MKQDQEIAHESKMMPIQKIAAKMGIPESEIEYYGEYKAKIKMDFCLKCDDRPNGKLILVSAISPTSAGEGKTTTTIGLVEALCKLGKRAAGALRQPSLGPVFGIKGGATGGGHAQVVPADDINLHFTGDFHAITSAHNMLTALLDNAIYQRKIEINPKRILWNRVLDINDRALRNIIVGLGGPLDGVSHQSSFDITAASEIMAILCLSKNISELREKLGNIILGYNYGGKAIHASDLGVTGAITVLLKDVIKPNLVQTLEHNPIFIHGGPFANIAQGSSSIIATRMALKLNDYVVTEAGFGSDLGAEKFFNLVCPYGGFTPSLMVLVATIRALKMHGGVNMERIKQEDLVALEKGMVNLGRHLENAKKFGIDTVVALNYFPSDTKDEIEMVRNYCKEKDFPIAVSYVYEKGGSGGEELANIVIQRLEEERTQFKYLYDWKDSVENKINTIAKEIYRAEKVEFEAEALEDLQFIKGLKLCDLPICMAKTQMSFSDDPNQLGAPTGFTMKVRRILIAAGAGFLIPLTGKILRMPGLPKFPAAESIDIDHYGRIFF
ncbi:MAG: formate--tetrahydrofolate ligase [Candidatus Lokiarchaeota archaeon]|nr:formate--tetrahydrofolate ligase [Candidatus Lokiarchaeota archaeon]